MQILDLRGKKLSQAQLRSILPRAGSNTGSMLETVEPIVDAVKQNGASAALDFGAQFDGVTAPSMRVPQDVIAQAEHTLDPHVRSALLTAISQVRAFHSAQKPDDQVVEVIPGGKVTERFVPIHRVGLYVPGGQAVYPSSVIMNVVPAQEAGVDSLVVASPPQKDHDGWPHPTILAACSLLGVRDVWAVGGAQAIALLAYGDKAQEIEPVDLITGPGNIFVATAKHIVQQDVGIDAEAGPTEIAVLADDSANPVFVAYDLISQAEHDEMAASILLTDSESLAQQVGEEVDSRYKVTRNSDRVAQALEGSQSGIILVDDMDAGVAVANAYAAEHLEIQTRNAEDVAGKIVNAGAIFIGDYSPVPLGDYAAGSNHVLPTSGTARYNSGLSTHTFLKPVHMISYDQNALERIGPDVITLANEELLPAHGEAIKARISPDTLSLTSPKDRS